MNENKNDSPTSGTDKKKILVMGVLAVAVIGAIASNFTSSPKEAVKDYAVDTAKSAGKKLVEKGVEYGKEKIAEKLEERQKQPVPVAIVPQPQAREPAVAPVVTNIGNPAPAVAPEPVVQQSGNALKSVVSDKYISVDNLPILAEQADKMLMNATMAGDFERVKYLVDSGVSLEFSDDALCYVNYDGTEGTFLTHNEKMPLTMPEARQLLGRYSPYKRVELTTSCSKTFLLAAASKLDREISPEEFGYFNPALRDGDKVRESQYDALKSQEKAREDIYHLLLSKTPEKDYYQLPVVFLNSRVPLSIRKDALERYIAHPKVAINEKTQPFYKAKGEAMDFFLENYPTNKQYMSLVSYHTNPWFSYFYVLTGRLVNYASAYETARESKLGMIKTESQFKPELLKLDLPELTVASMMEGRVSYEESTNSALWYYGAGLGLRFVAQDDFRPMHEINSEVALIHTIVESEKVNLNAQDQLGNSFLHHLSFDYSNRARPLAVVTRYLLNKGVNDKLLNKDGDTAFMIAQKNSLQNGGGWGELSKAYTDLNYN